MEQLLSKSAILTAEKSLAFERYLATKIDWRDRLIGIMGPRGTGKTTLMLQYLKKRPHLKGVYISLDDIYFSDNKLISFAEWYRNLGGQLLLIDEVHKYPDWAREIKNIYDTYPDLQIVFSGSSITDIMRQHADLSRRAVHYLLNGLSFREYLIFTGVHQADRITIDDMMRHHVELSTELTIKFRPLQHLADYLKTGYYPYFSENVSTYPIRLGQVVNMIIETDLQFIEGFDPANTRKILQLLYILAANVPFKPNMTKLSQKIGIHRNTLAQYIHYLDRARLINSLTTAGKSTSILQKPDKIYLENPNLHYTLAPQAVERGTLRESFVMNQLVNAGYLVELPDSGDFLVDRNYTIEVGGKEKGSAQIKKIPNSFVLADDMEVGALSKIPLWLTGFLY